MNRQFNKADCDAHLLTRFQGATICCFHISRFSEKNMKNAMLLFALYIIAVGKLAFSLTSDNYIPSPPLRLNNVRDSTITNLAITNPKGHCIQLSNCKNIKIVNCKLGPAKGNGVDIYSCQNITVESNWMEEIQSGVYALDSQGIIVEYNQVKNVQGPFPRGQMAQFDKVNGGGSRINFNRCENILGESYPEDAVNIYKSNGTESDPIQVIGNWIRGGGPSESGGGIMTGDGGGSYILVEDNILVNPGQYGLAIASGTHIMILNNLVYGKRLPFANVGLYVWNQYDSECADNIVEGNIINYINKNGMKNPCWNAENCPNTVFNNQCGAAIDSTILPEQILTAVRKSLPHPASHFSLHQNYPNPFNPATSIRFELAEDAVVNLSIYNSSGQKVYSLLDDRCGAGTHVIEWTGMDQDGRPVSSGVYFCRMNTKEFSQTRKMILMQ